MDKPGWGSRTPAASAGGTEASGRRTTLTLLIAFQTTGLPDAGAAPAECGAQEAAVVLWDELQRVARRFCGRFRMDLVEDATAMVFKRLYERGPRGDRPEDPRSDAGVRGWLAHALRNQVLDLLRREAREEPWDGDDDRRAVHDSPEGRLLEEEREEAEARAHEELTRAREDLLRRIVPRLAGVMRPRAGVAFAQTVDYLVALHDGAVTVDEVVLREQGELTPRARNVMDQRFCRARQRLLGAARLEAPAFPGLRADALRVLVAAL